MKKKLENSRQEIVYASSEQRFGVHLSLILTVALTIVLGLVMVFDTSSAEILDLGSSANLYLSMLKQIAHIILGLFVAYGVWKMGFERLLRYSFPLLCFFTLLLVLVFIPGIGITANGARRWLGFGPLSMQPSEFVKYLIPIYYIHVYLEHEEDGITLQRFLKLIAKIAIPMILILIEPDNRSTGIIGLSLLMLFLLTKVRFRYWALPMGVLMAIGIVAAQSVPYVAKRIDVYLHPELDLKGKGHQPHQAKIAVGMGGLFGRGLGESLQKLNYLPEAQNDYIVAIYAEEMGFVGIVGLTTLYVILTLLGFYIAFSATDPAAALVAAATTFVISIQAFINLGVVCALLPSTGLNLPFFSQGGTSLIVNLSAIALLLQINRNNRIKEIR